VRLRLARRSDLPGVRALLLQRDVAASELDVERLLRFDPSRRVVIAATAPLGGTETLVGVGAIDLADADEPDTLVVDEQLTDGLGALLADALVQRARIHTRRSA
jgi:hypothetical protein